MTTLAEYIASRPATNDPIGDFVADYQAEPLGPVESWEELREALDDLGIRHPQIVAAAMDLWREYQRHVTSRRLHLSMPEPARRACPARIASVIERARQRANGRLFAMT